MTESAVMTVDAAKAARLAELNGKLAAGCASGGVEWLSSPEGQAVVDELNIVRGKAKKPAVVVDPKLAEEKKGVNILLFGAEGDAASGQQAKLAEKLNTLFAKSFPLLKEKGASIEVILKLKGAGKGAASATGTSNSNKYARVLHRTETGERCRKGKHKSGLDVQGLGSIEKLKAAYPENAAQIEETLGTGEKRNALWNSSKNAEGKGDTKKVYVSLTDGTVLCLQS